MEQAWQRDEFVRDPSRLTLLIGLTGIDGDTFKHSFLMDKYGIQVNKTSRNSVLFMTNIGTTRSSVAYLIEVLVKLAEELDDELARLGPLGRRERDRRVAALTGNPPPLPNFSHFADRFRHDLGGPDGDLRAAYFLAYVPEACEYLPPEELAARVSQGREVVSAMFVTPYPPGFPILVPGQVVTADILAFMSALDTREIHGYLPNSATESSPTLRCRAAQAQRSLPTKWHRSQKLIMTDPVLPGSGRLATSLSSSSTASFTGPRSGEGGGPRGWLAEDRGLARRREPPTGPGVDHPGEDAVAHAVRDRGPRQRGSSPSTSLTSTSRTGGPGCAPKWRDPGCSGRPVQPQVLPRLLAGRGAGRGERRRSQLRPNRERWS
jgi:hypothetical protein